MRRYQTILAILAMASIFSACKKRRHANVPPSHTTQGNLKQIKVALMMYRDDTGFLPRVLEQLKPYVGNGPGGDEFNETVDMFHDAWGNHFVFIADTGGGPARVISYGSDGVAGGTRHAKDIEVIVPEKDTEERHNKTD